MRYRRLGRTGLGVSPICLGTMGFGPPTHPAQADRLVRSALELGINFIDTANCYDGPQRGTTIQGHAEQMLGEILAAGLRDEFVLLSKVGVPLREGPQHRGLSTTHIVRELDASLRRLKTDFLDVYMLHWPDPFAETDEVLRTIDSIMQAGKVRYFGVSNHLAWQVGEFLWKADVRNWPAVGVSEIPLNLLDRRFENDLPFYERNSIGVLAYQPLKGGVLSDRARLPEPGPAPNPGGEKIAGWNHTLTEQERVTLDELARLGQRMGLTTSELAIAWVIQQTAVTSVVLGARSLEQLASGLRAAQFSIEPDCLGVLDRLCPGPPKPKPRFAR